jgi:hypothetical protein
MKQLFGIHQLLLLVFWKATTSLISADAYFRLAEKPCSHSCVSPHSLFGGYSFVVWFAPLRGNPKQRCKSTYFLFTDHFGRLLSATKIIEKRAFYKGGYFI